MRSLARRKKLGIRVSDGVPRSRASVVLYFILLTDWPALALVPNHRAARQPTARTRIAQGPM